MSASPRTNILRCRADRTVATLAFAISALWVAACGDSDEHSHDVPAPYAGQVSPLDASSVADLMQGQITYEQFCAGCHGEKGLGDGPTGATLAEAPSNLVTGHITEDGDDYLLYVISEGRPAHSMPAFKGLLTQPNQIWQVILYLRHLQAEAAGTATDTGTNSTDGSSGTTESGTDQSSGTM